MYGQLNPIVSNQFFFSKSNDKIFIYKLIPGPVKNFSPGPSMAGASAAVVPGEAPLPWMHHGTTYPSSYILTDSPSVIQPINMYKPAVDCPPSQTWRVPDPYDCSIYHDCYHGTNLVSYCPAQLQYNPEKQSCDHPQNVQCKFVQFVTTWNFINVSFD